MSNSNRAIQKPAKVDNPLNKGSGKASLNKSRNRWFSTKASKPGYEEETPGYEESLQSIFYTHTLNWPRVDENKILQLLRKSNGETSNISANEASGGIINCMFAGHSVMLTSIKESTNEHRLVCIIKDPNLCLYNQTAHTGVSALSGHGEANLQAVFSRLDIQADGAAFGIGCAQIFQTVMGIHPMSANYFRDFPERIRNFFGVYSSFASINNPTRSLVFENEVPDLLICDEPISPPADTDENGEPIPGILCIGKNDFGIRPGTLLSIDCFPHFEVEGVRFTTFQIIINTLKKHLNITRSFWWNVLCAVITKPGSLNICKGRELLCRQQSVQQQQEQIVEIAKGQIQEHKRSIFEPSESVYVGKGSSNGGTSKRKRRKRKSKKRKTRRRKV